VRRTCRVCGVAHSFEDVSRSGYALRFRLSQFGSFPRGVRARSVYPRLVMKMLAVLWSVVSAAGLLAYEPSDRSPIDVSKLGPQVGERVPDFTLKDQNGTTWTLQSVMGPKGAMLVFYRSADW